MKVKLKTRIEFLAKLENVISKLAFFIVCELANLLLYYILLDSKTLGTKCIRTSMCIVLANHDQNLEYKFRLLKVCLCVKLESSDCRIYWTKSARFDRSKIRLDRSNLLQIDFLQNFQLSPNPYDV